MSSEPPSSPFLPLAGFAVLGVDEDEDDECLRSFFVALVSSAGGGTAAGTGGGTAAAAASALSRGTSRLAVRSVETVRSDGLYPSSLTCTSNDGAPFFTETVSGVTPSSSLPVSERNTLAPAGSELIVIFTG